MKALYKIFKKRGNEVRILTPGYRFSRGRKIGDIIQIGKGASVFAGIANDSVGAINFFLDTQDQIQKVLSYEKFDLIHFHSLEVPFLSWQILAESKCANVTTFHMAVERNRKDLSFQILLNIVSPLAKSISLQLDGAIAVSKTAADAAKRLCGVQVEAIIPNGVDVERFNPKVPPLEECRDGKINILYVGRLDPRKGVLYLLKAYSIFKSKFPKSRLIIVGDGPQREMLEEFVEVEKLKEVVFAGFVDEAELPRYYTTADIFCSPAIHGESFGIVLLEAMAAGRAIVATNNIGYRNVLTGLGKHCLVPVKDAGTLAAKLIEFTKNETLRLKLAEWGRKEVKRYSWNLLSNEIFQFYEKTIRKNKAKRKPLREKVINKVKQWIKLGQNIGEENIPFYDSIRDTFFDEGEWYKK